MIEFFKKNLPDSDNLIGLLESTFRSVSLQKNDIIEWPGEVCRKMYYIEEGCVMIRYVEDDIEKAVSFYFEGEFVSAFESFKTEAPSEFYLQCLENTKLHFITKKEYEMFTETYPEISRLTTEFLGMSFLKHFQFTSRLLAYSVEKMYLYLLKEHPQIIQRVPLKFVAEFMGITKEHLSRLRKKLATKDSTT